jgi:LemA protein
MATLIVFIALGALLVFGVSIYNRLVGLRNASEGAWSDIDVQLKRRHDLIPNLVETVKGYASHESETFERVTQARNQAVAARGPKESSAAEGQLQGVLRSLFALAEAYPDLKANESFLALQSQLSGLEDAIQNARRYYNAIVRDLNTACDVFPSNLVAGGFGITKKDYFEIEDAARETPEVDFGAAR